MPALFAAIDHAEAGNAMEVQAKVRLSPTDIGNISPSVLRSSGNSAMPTARLLGDRGLVDRNRLAVDQHRSGPPAQHAEQRQQKFALTLPVEAAEPDNLAGPHRE
jgi:hypothetical protein